MSLIVLPVILAMIIGFAIVAVYNGLVTRRNRCENAWAQVDVQLKKRADLVPNLVETVKGYASHEKGVFEAVTKARASIMSAGSVADMQTAQNGLTAALKSLFAVVEAYPQLKADSQFILLQEQLDGIESKIAYARQFYNDEVLGYSNTLQVFPTNIIAGMFNFKAKDYFQVAEAEKEPVKVKF
ncbi:MAG: LemA family protein [Candidatus Firestonebacteria bacterium]|nr:LemA family protein [Candidatus Firestonebacteria bacterium]